MAPSFNGVVVYGIFLLLGAGTLFPWNAFITVNAYYSSRYCGSAFADDYLAYYGVVFNLFEVVTLVGCVTRGWNYVLVPLHFFVLIFVLTSLSVFLDDISAGWVFSLTIFSLACVGVLTALLSGGVFGLGAGFPPKYTQAIMSGQGLAGTVVSISEIATLWVAGMDDSFCSGQADDNDDRCEDYKVDWAAFAYFAVAVVTLASCILAYQVLESMEITKFYRSIDVNAAAAGAVGAGAGDRGGSGSGSGSSDEDCADNEKANVIKEPLLEFVDGNSSGISSVKSSSLDLGDGSPSPSPPLQAKGDRNGHLSELLQLVSYEAFSVFFVFLVTLGLFPALTSKIVSTSKCSQGASRIQNDLFAPLSFLNYNFFDFLGRIASGRCDLRWWTGRRLLWASVSRLAFFPLFLLCDVDNSALPTLFNSDVYPVMGMVLFAFSNGLISSLCMMVGPTRVPEEHRIKTGNIMIGALSAGLMAGSALSFITLFIATGSF